MTTQQSLPITRPTVTPREEAYGARVLDYSKMKDVTDEFQVWGLIAPLQDVKAVLYHKPCYSIIYVTLYIDTDFYCVRCNKRYQLANIYPLKIVEVPTVEY